MDWLRALRCSFDAIGIEGTDAPARARREARCALRPGFVTAGADALTPPQRAYLRRLGCAPKDADPFGTPTIQDLPDDAVVHRAVHRLRPHGAVEELWRLDESRLQPALEAVGVLEAIALEPPETRDARALTRLTAALRAAYVPPGLGLREIRLRVAVLRDADGRRAVAHVAVEDQDGRALGGVVVEGRFGPAEVEIDVGAAFRIPGVWNAITRRFMDRLLDELHRGLRTLGALEAAA